MSVSSRERAMEKIEATQVEEPLAPGSRVLDRYVVVDRLERGGTSIIYRGEDERLSRPVCIKVFHTLRKKEGIYRTTYEHFVQEAFALSKLSHPNTLRIYDFGHLPASGTPAAVGAGPEAEGPPFQVSEFMSGGTLSSLVRSEGSIGREEAARIVVAVGGALSEAHEIGLIHRDIKPKNILFGGTGPKRIPKLADFGIAKSIELAGLRHRAGDTHVVAGKRLLMFSGLWAAPEQLVADSVSTASDIYSLALVMIYMLTGRCVFSASTPADAYRERNESDTLIDQALAGADLPQPVIDLFKQACAFSPKDRPRDVDRFARAFADCLAGNQAEPTSSSEIRTSPMRPVPLADGSRPDLAADPVKSVPSPDRHTSAQAPARTPPQRITPSQEPQPLWDRTAYFVAARDATIDLTCAGGAARIRLSLVPTGHQVAVHIKGLSCFVRKQDGRPTGAVHLLADGVVELLARDRSPLARVEIHHGRPAAGHTIFPVGDREVAVASDDARHPVALDFGPGAEILFVHSGPDAAR